MDADDASIRERKRRTRKFLNTLLGDQFIPSVQRWMLLSSTQKTKTAPDLTNVLRSVSFIRRVVLGTTPFLEAPLRTQKGDVLEQYSPCCYDHTHRI